MSASDLLRAARSVRGVSQRSLAKTSRVPQSRISDIEVGAHDTTVSRLEELLAPLGQRVTLLPTRSRPVWEASLAILEALSVGDENRAWREVIQLSDDLAANSGALRVALCVAPPVLTGDVHYDALIAGIADHWLTCNRLPRPDWVTEPSRILTQPWDVEQVASLQSAARSDTPKAIARHGIYLAAAELSSI